MIAKNCILYNFHGNKNDINELYNKISTWVSIEKPSLENVLIGAFSNATTAIADCGIIKCAGKLLELDGIYPINSKTSEFNFYVDSEITKLISIVIDMHNWKIDFDYIDTDMVMGG